MLSVDDIRKAVAPVAEKYGVKRVFLFGSYARGDNAEKSDIDLRCEGGKIYGDWAHNHFQEDIQEALSVKVDVVCVSNPNSEFLQRISGDHVLLYEEGAFLENPVFIPKGERVSSYLSKTQRDIIILRRVLRYCKEVPEIIQRFGDNFEAFSSDFAYKNSVAMSIFQIGEHTNRLSEDFRGKFKDMPWPKIKAMRNVIAHEYYEVDVAGLWKVAHEYVPELQDYCQQALGQLEEEEN